MNELIFALIEWEREGDEMFGEVDAAALTPTTVLEDADGRRLQMYKDASYAAL